MYDVKHIRDDFPWTRVRDASVEPWRRGGTGWMDDALPGWGDALHEHLLVIDRILKEHDATDRFVIAQFKEKWGMARMYWDVIGKDGFPLTPVEAPWLRELSREVIDMEESTRGICCWCGATEGVVCRNGWVHWSCDACESAHGG